MIDWQRRVRILKAENAVRDGRLDEAFGIASEKEMRDWRACQVILEKLVDPFLERAGRHFEEGRLEDALADVERAQVAGGNRPRTAELRAKIREKLEERRARNSEERRLLASARRHLAHGSVGAGKALLEEVAAADPEAKRLRREAEQREARGRDALARAEMLLSEGALLEALRAAGEALTAWSRLETLPPLLLKLKGAASTAIARALEAGNIDTAEELQDHAVRTCGESLETRRSGEALKLCRDAAGRVAARDYEGASAALARLDGLVINASWIASAREALKSVAEGLRALQAGPLASSLAAAGRSAGLGSTVISPAARERPRNEGAARDGRDADDRSSLLWVDGVGTFLLLRGDRISLGRAGSSSRPDLPLAADIAGVQAEVVRVDEDYFLAAHGEVLVNGRRADRKLLADGDRISLVSRCELVFRLPSPMSTSAVLSLRGGLRVAGDVREVVLLDKHFLLGPSESAHVRAAAAPCQIVISSEERGLVARADEDIAVDGKPAGREAVVTMGAQIKVGELTFTVGPLDREKT